MDYFDRLNEKFMKARKGIKEAGSFNSSDHPRDDDGEFSSTGHGSSGMEIANKASGGMHKIYHKTSKGKSLVGWVEPSRHEKGKWVHYRKPGEQSPKTYGSKEDAASDLHHRFVMDDLPVAKPKDKK